MNKTQKNFLPKRPSNLLIIFFFLFFFSGRSQEESDDECRTIPDCGARASPDIRFPFWAKASDGRRDPPARCRPAGFGLSCTDGGETLLFLDHHLKQQQQERPPLTLLVNSIDCASQTLTVSDAGDCFPRRLRDLDFNASRFEIDGRERTLSSRTLFNCSPSAERERSLDLNPVPCLSINGGNQVYAIDSDDDLQQLPLFHCEKSGGSSPPLPWVGVFDGSNELYLMWRQPDCSGCEAKGKKCRFKDNDGEEGAATGIECYPLPPAHDSGVKAKLKVTGYVLGPFLLALIVLGCCYIYKAGKSKKENRAKIEKFLEDYRAFKPTRYSYADIKRITDQFKYRLGQGGYGTVFKGKLSNEIFVAVKILNSTKGDGEDFINEVGTMGRIHHVNVVRLVGFCADGLKRALVYEFLRNESLEKFIFSESIKKALGWKKLKDIALGIAKGIEYLHQGCEQRILHFDIKPHNILLDHNFNPKISDFGLAKLCAKEKSVVSMTAARGTVGYISPEVFSRNFGNVSHKSDVYSFGMLLLDMVGGRKNNDVAEESSNQGYFPDWIYNRLEQGEVIGTAISTARDADIAKQLTVVGLWCIQWYPIDRPSMKFVVQMLEAEGESLTMPPNPFATASTSTESTIRRRKNLNSELAVISESD